MINNKSKFSVKKLLKSKYQTKKNSKLYGDEINTITNECQSLENAKRIITEDKKLHGKKFIYVVTPFILEGRSNIIYADTNDDE